MNLDDLITDAERDEPAEPGTEQWRSRITASKIPAILGVSRYQTPLDVWNTLAGVTQPETNDSIHTLRGTLMEPVVANLVAFDRPDWQIAETGGFQSLEHPWAHATPDRLVKLEDGTVAALEIKTCSTWTGWGPDGSDVIPTAYWFQCQWQNIVLGVPIIIVAMGPGYSLRYYPLMFDEWDNQQLLLDVEAFRESITEGTPPTPDVLDLSSVLQRTPVYRGWVHEVDPDDSAAVEFAKAVLNLDTAQQHLERTKLQLLDQLGTAEALQWRGINLLSRTSSGGLRTASATTIKPKEGD